MATAMKFGPEWLRALSDGGPNASATSPPITSSGPPKYKLAEYRYGREEMLALFNHNLKPPENLEEFPHIFVDKMQLPLALTNMTEDESRLWNRVNSDVVLRLVGKGGGSAPERGDRNMNERGGVSMRSGRGGILSERGRGRGRGYYQRNNYEDNGDSPPERRDFRNRSFERNHSLNEENVSRDKKYERTFSRGGGNGGTAEDNLLLRKNNSRSSAVENWRTGGRGEDREGWRTARGPIENTWNRSNSWRSGDREKEYEEEHLERNGPHRKYNNYQKDRNPNDLWDDIEENDRRNSLPEWSLDDGPELDAKVGTFDASGAFREDTNDDEETKLGDALNEDQKDESREPVKSEKISKKSNQNSKSDNNNESRIENMNKNIEKTVKRDENSNRKASTNTSQNQSKQHLLQKHPNSTQASSQTPSNTSNKLFNKSNDSSNCHNIKSPFEEDGFAHLEKEAENMVAQWTADDDQKEEPGVVVAPVQEEQRNSIIVLPVQHEDALKWFYRDPQNEIQGPFTPHEMYDWFTAGYFAMDLLVRRGCDEQFSQLGELFKLWDRIPFVQVQGSTPPPLRLQSSNPSHSSLTSSTSHPPVHSMGAPAPQHLLHQQLVSQPPQPSHSTQPQTQNVFMNQQSVDMQSQLRLLLAQLKKQEGFSDLSQQQQQEVLVQRYVRLERQRQQSLQTSIPNTRTAEESQMSSLDALSNLRIQNTRPIQPIQVVNNAGHVQSIWDMNSGALSVSQIEEMQRKEQEMKELEERRKAFEEEQNRKKLEQEELQRKIAEERERKFEELQKKLEEERLRNQELLRKQEEEKRRREEEERLRMEEEERRTAERVAEEQKRRHEELLRLEEYSRRQALQEEEKRRQMAIEKERQRQQLQEIEVQRERAKEMERMRQLQQQQQQEAIIKLQQQQEKQRSGKVWGGQGGPEQNQKQQSSLSLDDIQRIQEEKDREERQRQLQAKHMQALFAAQHQQQQQQNKQSLSWAAPTYQQNAPVKTLAEIQREESEKVAKQRVADNKKLQTHVTNNVPNAGIWNNANSQLFGQAGPPTQTNSSANNASVPIGFWEPESRKVQSNRANESAFNSMQSNSNSKGNNTNQFQSKASSRNRKEEETVLRLFENQRRQKTDEFTQWCIEALSRYQSSVDIPTFISFLKDVESPFEINDYIRQYLGESKDVKEFAKQFVEKRSQFRNQAKREATQELMWGPAPAITPSANKPLTQSLMNSSVQSTESTDMSGFITAGKKKKKGKRVIDNSILGFTVQADPDRINAGQIEQIDD